MRAPAKPSLVSVSSGCSSSVLLSAYFIGVPTRVGPYEWAGRGVLRGDIDWRNTKKRSPTVGRFVYVFSLVPTD